MPASGVDGAPEVVAQSMEGNLGVQFDDDLSAGFAASVVNVWQFDGHRMSKPFVHLRDPGLGPTGTIALHYSAATRDGRHISLEWPFDGEKVSYRYEDLTVAPSYVAFGEREPKREWRVSAGEVTIESLPNGQAQVSLTHLEIVEQLGASEGTPQPIPDGSIIGDVEDVCLEYVDVPGVPVDGDGVAPPQAQRDEDWSSPYCAQLAR